MSQPLMIVVPVYGQFPYARLTLASFFASSPPGSRAVVVDDGSPGWSDDWLQDVGGPFELIRHPVNRGLTAAWNTGLALALTIPSRVIIAANSDLQFSPGWWQGAVAALDHGWDMTGPVTNAPGPTSHGIQDVRKWIPYQATDDKKANAIVTTQLYHKYGRRAVPSAINGFCMLAKKEAWQQVSHDAGHVFPPVISRMPSGRKNPWPLMCAQDDWISSRLKSGVAIGSFCFHFRSKSRGEKFVKYGGGK